MALASFAPACFTVGDRWCGTYITRPFCTSTAVHRLRTTMGLFARCLSIGDGTSSSAMHAEARRGIASLQTPGSQAHIARLEAECDSLRAAAEAMSMRRKAYSPSKFRATIYAHASGSTDGEYSPPKDNPLYQDGLAASDDAVVGRQQAVVGVEATDADLRDALLQQGREQVRAVFVRVCTAREFRGGARGKAHVPIWPPSL
jgi:hypothetical protein